MGMKEIQEGWKEEFQGSLEAAAEREQELKENFLNFINGEEEE